MIGIGLQCRGSKCDSRGKSSGVNGELRGRAVAGRVQAIQQTQVGPNRSGGQPEVQGEPPGLAGGEVPGGAPGAVVGSGGRVGTRPSWFVVNARAISNPMGAPLRSA